MFKRDFAAELQKQLMSGGDGTLFFLPAPLPPQLPALTWDFAQAVIDAERAVSELKGLAVTLPNPYLLANAFARREATLSSKIEGTQSGLRELLLFEAGDSAAQKTDAREISNYIRAMEHGLRRLKEIPLCLNLMLEMHAILLEGQVRGADKKPGRFRRASVWIGPRNCVIGDATYVPPPWSEVEPAMAALEKYLHAASPLPLLVRLALVHYQFEAVHPFEDGNGRIGRLLVPLMLCERGFLNEPLLYLSAYFERHRDAYYDHLLDVSRRGAWMGWITFFLRGVAEEGRDGVQRARRLLELRDRYRRTAEAAKMPATSFGVIDTFFATPILSLSTLTKNLGISYNAAQSAIRKLEDKGIVTEITGQQRNRVYLAPEVLEAIQLSTAAPADPMTTPSEGRTQSAS